MEDLKPVGLKAKASPTKAGKKPLTEKQGPGVDLEEWSPVGNALNIPPKLEKIAEEREIQYRWLSAKTLATNTGYHPKGWKVFKVPEGVDVGLEDFHIGRSPDHTLRRGTMVLGYKPNEAAAHHREHLEKRAALYTGEKYAKQKADKIRAMSKDGNVKVIEGYEENG